MTLTDASPLVALINAISLSKAVRLLIRFFGTTGGRENWRRPRIWFPAAKSWPVSKEANVRYAEKVSSIMKRYTPTIENPSTREERTRILTFGLSTCSATSSAMPMELVEVSDELEPCAVNACAVVRTETIPHAMGRSSEQLTSRRMSYPNPKGRRNKSMTLKRNAKEDVYDAVAQRLSDKAKARLPESNPQRWNRTSVGSTSEHRCPR